MFDKFCGIICRTNYLIAIILTLCGIAWLANSSYAWYKEPKLQSWKFVDHKQLPTKKSLGSFENLSDRTLELLASSNNIVHVELSSGTEIVKFEIDGKFASMSKQEQDKDILEIADTVWTRKYYNWDAMLYMIFLPLIIAFLLHRVTVWIIWGKVK
jgi:hypothetical protein